MLSKCANPDCSETFRYLHQGKIFCLAPTPEVETLTGKLRSVLDERFWLCARCSKEMTLTWSGRQVRLVRLSTNSSAVARGVAREDADSPARMAACAGRKGA
jgi:hypothetical protein